MESVNANEFVAELRCECGKLLAMGYINSGYIEIKCRACKTLSQFTVAVNSRYKMNIVETSLGVTITE